MKIFRFIILLFSFCLFWQASIYFLILPDYILPSPLKVIVTLYQQKELIVTHAIPTIIEIFFGLILGVILGFFAGISIAFFQPIKIWLLPILIISQAIPTFAIAPLFVIWFGYSLLAKILMTSLMIFFPVTNALVDGFAQTPRGWLDLANSMHSSRLRTFIFIRLPAALPKLASGIKVATTMAPIGAIVGEWVGSSKGLGYLMLNANARLQIDSMFAALIVIILLSLSIYFIVDKLLQKWLWWERHLI